MLCSFLFEIPTASIAPFAARRHSVTAQASPNNRCVRPNKAILVEQSRGHSAPRLYVPWVHMKFGRNWLRALSVGLLMIALTGCTQVDAGNLGIVTKWGEIQDVALQEGIHFRTPVKTQIINISTRVHKMEASASASSKDLQVVSTKIALNYRIDASRIVEVFRNVGTRLVVENTIIDPALQESLKQATAQYTAEELITKRQQVKETLGDSIKATLAKSDILVTELSITDFQFDAQYQQAVESKQVAEQRPHQG